MVLLIGREDGVFVCYSEFRVAQGVFWVRKKKVWDASKTRTKVTSKKRRICEVNV